MRKHVYSFGRVDYSLKYAPDSGKSWGGARNGSGRKMGNQYLKAENWVESQTFWMYAHEFTTWSAAFNASLKMKEVLGDLFFQVHKIEDGAFTVITRYNPLSRV